MMTLERARFINSRVCAARVMLAHQAYMELPPLHEIRLREALEACRMVLEACPRGGFAYRPPIMPIGEVARVYALAVAHRLKPNPYSAEDPPHLARQLLQRAGIGV